MAEKKKILYIVEAMGGGVFTYIVDLANELVNKYDMYIAYAVRKQTPKNYKDYFDKRIHLIEVKNFGRAINPTKDIAAFFEVKKIAAEVKPDVIHLHSSKAGAIGRVAFDGKIPMFYTPHGYSFLMENCNPTKRRVFKLIESVCAKRNCTTISCSVGEHQETLKLKDIEKEFKEAIGDRIASICSAHNVTVDYAFQDINDIPGELPAGRTKPWGTGQAVLAAKDVIKTPFIVINADDYYGKEGFKAVYEYLVNGGKSCMAGFVLKNTLSDNGGVTRGICKMDENGNLTEVVETKNIVKTADGAEADGVVVDVNSLVSMNMWGLTPDFLDVLENGFKEFFEKEVPSNPQKAEYLIPIFIGELLEQGKMSVKVLKTNDTWYGMTYHEDVAAVKNSFKKMLADGVYKADLFSDL